MSSNSSFYNMFGKQTTRVIPAILVNTGTDDSTNYKKSSSSQIDTQISCKMKYAKSIVFAYKNRSSYEYLNFQLFPF